MDQEKEVVLTTHVGRSFTARTTRYIRGAWEIVVGPGVLVVSSGKSVPYTFTVGTVYRDGKIRISTPAASKPRGYREAAKHFLEDARSLLIERGMLEAPSPKKASGEWSNYKSKVVTNLIQYAQIPYVEASKLGDEYTAKIRASWATAKPTMEVAKDIWEIEKEAGKVGREEREKARQARVKEILARGQVETEPARVIGYRESMKHERGDNPITTRRAAVIERSAQAFERAREAHDPKRFKRGGRYDPEEYKEIARKAGLKKPPSNLAKGKLELHKFVTERPTQVFAYYKGDPTKQGATITTRMGDVIGHIISKGDIYKAGRGYPQTRMLPVRVRAITGDTYAGTANLDTGTYVKLKKVKGPSAAAAAAAPREAVWADAPCDCGAGRRGHACPPHATAAKHEAGGNPRVSSKGLQPSDMRPGFMSLVNIRHPEWGTWGVVQSAGQNMWEIRGERGNRIIDVGELGEWKLAKHEAGGNPRVKRLGSGAPLAVVMLDDPRYGVGPGTILEVSNETVSAILARYTDRDGARPAALRLWRASRGDKKGDRVMMAREPFQATQTRSAAKHESGKNPHVAPKKIARTITRAKRVIKKREQAPAARVSAGMRSRISNILGRR